MEIVCGATLCTSSRGERTRPPALKQAGSLVKSTLGIDESIDERDEGALGRLLLFPDPSMVPPPFAPSSISDLTTLVSRNPMCEKREAGETLP